MDSHFLRRYKGMRCLLSAVMWLDKHAVWQCCDDGANVIAYSANIPSTLTVLVTTIDAQWEGMGDVGSARYEPALLPPCPTIMVLSYSNW